MWNNETRWVFTITLLVLGLLLALAGDGTVFIGGLIGAALADMWRGK